jgi:hypothetical protein
MSSSSIAIRRFTVGKDSEHYIEVVVHSPTEDRGDYRCDYEILEHGEILKRGHALGVDSLQALILALQRLGVDVESLDYRKEMRLYWNDQSNDLGLLLPMELR